MLIFGLVVFALVLWGVLSVPAVGDFIERRFFAPAFSDGGTVECSGEIIRKTGERVPFRFVSGVTLSSSVIVAAMHKAMPSMTAWGRMRGAVTHPTAVRNAIADLVVDRVDAGAGAGTIQFQTSADAQVATLTYSDPAYGNAAAGTATANSITSDTNATGGTVAKSRHFDSNSTEVFATAVGTSGSDINMSSLSVGSGDTVSMSSLTYSAPN
jgi:hypothetical protein